MNVKFIHSFVAIQNQESAWTNTEATNASVIMDMR